MMRDLVDDVIRELNDTGERRWQLGGRLAGGRQSGAWRVTDEDGVVAVVKVTEDSDWSRQVTRAEAAVAAVRRAGYPTPAWLAAGTTGSGIAFQIQELVGGAIVETLDLEHARALIEVIEQQSRLDPDPERCWSDFLVEQLTIGFEGLRSAASSAGPSGAELLDRCDRLLGDPDRIARIDWPRTDMVHGDFRPGNVLFAGHSVSGVVDIEAIGSGPRAFDYATLLSYIAIEPDAVELLVAAGSACSGRPVLRACVAWAFLDLVRFSSRRSDVGAAEREESVRGLSRRAAVVERLTSG